MTSVATGALVALAALSLGLRTSSVLTNRIHPIARLVVAAIVGAIFTAVVLQLSEQYHVYDMGLGLLVSLSPVGIFDLAKWWFRWGK